MRVYGSRLQDMLQLLLSVLSELLAIGTIGMMWCLELVLVLAQRS